MNTTFLTYTGYVVFGILTFVAIGATVLPFFHLKQWYFRIFDYPRLQTFFIALMALLWFAFMYFKAGMVNWVVMALLLVVMMVQAYKAFPYTIFASKQVLASSQTDNKDDVSFLICNVLQSNDDYGKVLNAIRKNSPDIVITTESDKKWESALSGLNSEYSELIPVPQDNKYGMHLFSRLPLRNSQVRYLLEDDIPSIKTQVQLASGDWIDLFVVHPRPPFPTEDDDSKQRDAEILMVGREAAKIHSGAIVAGDFNDVAWSRTTALFQEVSGFLDPRRGRGFFNTFHAGYPIFRWPLDHIFHSSHFRLVSIKRLGNVGSDHFPMFVSLSYEPEDKAAQPEVKKDEDTEEKANEAIQKGKTESDEQ